MCTSFMDMSPLHEIWHRDILCHGHDCGHCAATGREKQAVVTEISLKIRDYNRIVLCTRAVGWSIGKPGGRIL